MGCCTQVSKIYRPKALEVWPMSETLLQQGCAAPILLPPCFWAGSELIQSLPGAAPYCRQHAQKRHRRWPTQLIQGFPERSKDTFGQRTANWVCRIITSLRLTCRPRRPKVAVEVKVMRCFQGSCDANRQVAHSHPPPWSREPPGAQNAEQSFEGCQHTGIGWLQGTAIGNRILHMARSSHVPLPK